MAQRVLNDNFWTDNWVEELNPSEKLIFIYLLTNPLCNIAWAYEIKTKRIAYETGYSQEEIEKILKKFEDDIKIVRYEDWIVIVNFIKNQSKNPKVEVGIRRIVEDLPKSLIKAVYDRLCIAYAYPMYSLSHFTLLNYTILNYINFNISSLRSDILKQPEAENFKWEVEKSLANFQTSNAEISLKNFSENKKVSDTPKGGETDLWKNISLKNFSKNQEKPENDTKKPKNNAKENPENLGTPNGGANSEDWFSAVANEYGNTEINAIIQAIIDFHGTCDGTKTEQRKYGQHLKNKISKIRGFDWDFYNFVKKICEKTNKFYITKTTSPKGLYENLTLLISAIRSQNSQQNSVENTSELTAEDIKNREEKIAARENSEAKKRRLNEEKIKKEKTEKAKILKFFHEKLPQEKREEIEKKADEKYKNSPVVKKWDTLYEIEIVRLTKPFFTEN